jgi:hypothetical protein
MPFRFCCHTNKTTGTVTMTGAENTVFEVTEERVVEGYVDLTNMQAGDSISVKEYMRIASGGAYVLYGSQPLNDAQTIALLWITPKPGAYGVKLTIQQTAGVNRTFAYAVFKENRR